MPKRTPSEAPRPAAARLLIALVGDYDPAVVAHRAIEKCFELASQSGPALAQAQWVPTASLVRGDERFLDAFHGIWCIPASPYENTAGALWAIEYARTRSTPFLGTCGGYQHAVLEYARNVLGLANAGHSELDPTTPLPLLSRLRCPLIERPQRVIVSNEAFRPLYGGDAGFEGYHCSYGLNPDLESVFTGTAFEIVARSEDGEPRAFRLTNHPFFVGTQFQPERRALEGSIHPLVAAFFSATDASAG